MLNRLRNLSLLCAAFAILGLGAGKAWAGVTPVVLAINYASPDVVIHSGSVMTVYCSAVVPSQAVDISVTAANVGSITLASSYFQGLAFGTPIYITDGLRAWKVQAAAQPTLVVTNGNLIGPPVAPFLVSDYTTVVNSAFRGYTGTLVNSADGNAPQVSVFVGSFGNLALHDDGNVPVNGDLASGDGQWTGLYTVPDLGFKVTNGSFFATVLDGGTSNDTSAVTSQSVAKFNIDGIRPQIASKKVSFRRTNYQGLMYLSSLDEGTTHQCPANCPSPANDQARVDVVVNKANVAVNFTVQTAAGAVSLPTLIFPSSAPVLTGWRSWDGRDPNGTFVTPGNYALSISINDLSNPSFTGATLTDNISVVDLNMTIKNISLTPSSSYVGSPSTVITSVSYDSFLSNDSGSSLAPSLSVLGWVAPFAPTAHADRDTFFSGPFTSYTGLGSGVFMQPSTQFLNPNGTVAMSFPGIAGNKDDQAWVNLFAGDFPVTAAVTLPFACGQDSTLFEPVGITIGATVASGQGSGFDPQIMTMYQVAAGSVNVPTLMQARTVHKQYTPGTIFIGSTPPPGSYTLQIHNVLTGMLDCFTPDQSLLPDAPAPCSPSAGNVYYTQTYHFTPDMEPGPNCPSHLRGRGIYTDDTSAIFSVNSVQNTTADTTPPSLSTSNPLSGARIDPSITLYSANTPLTALVQGSQTPLNNSNSVSYATLQDSNGHLVSGATGNDGGNPVTNQLTISFAPKVPLTTGGNYTFTVFSCSNNGLCMQATVPFTVQDETAPSVSSVQLVSSTQQNNISLPVNQASPTGPYDDITQVWANLYINASKSTNTVAWAASSISVYQIVSGTSVPVPVTPIAETFPPGDGNIKVRLLTPISSAGLYQVVVQTASTDNLGNVYNGPPTSSGWVAPEFITQVNPAVLNVNFSNSGNRVALQGSQPLTITAQPGSVNVPASAASIQAVVPALLAFPTPSFGGYLPVTQSAGNSHALMLNPVGLTFTPRLQYNYSPLAPVSITLHYDDADIAPYGVPNSSLVMLGYDGTNWQTLVPAPSSAPNNGTNNTFTWQPSVNQLTYVAYGIFYPSTVPGGTPRPTATSIAFTSTRSFNPVGGPVVRQARFFYGNSAPQTAVARIYDTQGRLVRTLSLGSGINAGDSVTDPGNGNVGYYFQWDGANDNGTLVRNGVYLVHWQVTLSNGTSNSQTKLVALIK